MANSLKADAHIISRKPAPQYALRSPISDHNRRCVLTAIRGEVAEVLIKKRLSEDQLFTEVRVAVVGNVDSGKSTLLGPPQPLVLPPQPCPF
jgi:GTPase